MVEISGHALCFLSAHSAGILPISSDCLALALSACLLLFPPPAMLELEARTDVFKMAADLVLT